MIMNIEILDLALRFAGCILLGLVVANFVAAKRLKYAENLAEADLLVRQIFHVHCAYIVAIITALAALCLLWPNYLLEGSGLSRAVCGFFGLFWFSRVIVQLTYYDPAARSEDRAWDLFFLAVFLGLSATFTLATIYQ
jgi:hypothetical protein